MEKINILFEDWTPCPAALLWQGALRSSLSTIDFFRALSWGRCPGIGQMSLLDSFIFLDVWLGLTRWQPELGMRAA
ncbi:hypothetical protein DBR11_00415 [Pedobacter sp. HMWF019]|nr:hypothetical protein DBR11_00415 [Pedobacter sp. HMWF019]